MIHVRRCLFGCLVFATFFQAMAFTTTEVFNERKKEKYFQVENDIFRMQFYALGGRVMSCYYKAGQTDLTNPEANGSTTENCWDIPASRFFLQTKPFSRRVQEGPSSYRVSFSGNHSGGGINFLRVNKAYTMFNDRTLFHIDYEFENMEAAMARLNYSFWIHHTWGILKEKGTYFFPTTSGIVSIPPNKRPTEYWGHHPARGWMGVATPSGTGVVVTMRYPEVKQCYTWMSTDKVPTLEWRMVPVGIDAGKSYKTHAEVVAFQGLTKISGAGAGLVGAIYPGKKAPEPGDVVPLEVKVYHAHHGTVEAELRKRVLPGGKWQSVQRTELAFPEMGMVRSFKSAVTRQDEGQVELEVILRSGGKELARLNEAVNFGESTMRWSIAPLEKRMESSVPLPDLTRFTSCHPTPCVAWAKPLHGGRLKVLVLTNSFNVPEIGQLAQRLDMDYATTYLSVGYSRTQKKLNNPTYVLGDYCGILTTTDVEENLRNILKKDYDAIVIGGFPWSVFPSFAQKTMLEKIKKGTGLLYIGPEVPSPVLGLKKVKHGMVRQVPRMTRESPLTMGVPFAMLGAEPVYPYATTGVVHARVGDFPYLVENRIGQGVALSLLYYAAGAFYDVNYGLTPELEDFYETHASPYEHYYSMIAKAICHVANRKPLVRFSQVRRTQTGMAFALENDDEFATQWEIRVADRFRNEKHVGHQSFRLTCGRQRLTVPVPFSPYAGPQTVSVIIRDAQGAVLNWGSWVVEQAPQCSIEAIATTSDHYRHGETVPFTATLVGDVSGMSLHGELIDSYDRVVARWQSPASARLNGSMTILNELPARGYVLRITLWDGNREIDRRCRQLIVRPKQECLVWDDFEVGTWLNQGARFYLADEQTKVLGKLRIKTLISNYFPMVMRFAIRHNFHPTFLHHAGLMKCAEPSEYAKTGDKMLLKRGICLSTQKFEKDTLSRFNWAAKSEAKYTPRFFWMGDEQSLTGYSGAPIDFCFSEDCLREFRKFLKERYKSLTELNRQWETSFDSWEDVIPFTYPEILAGNEKHVAGWADHLEFMDGRLIHSMALAKRGVHAQNSDIRLSICGTQPPTAYGGMDWWRQMQVLDSLMNYGVGGQFDIQRSFSPKCEFMPWALGYNWYGSEAISSVWHTIFLGFRGIMGYNYSSLFNPDWTLSRPARDSKDHLARICDGVGKHIINNVKSLPEVAILYSQASIRAAFIESRRQQHRDLRQKYIKLLRNIGVNFNFISYEQLADGILRKGQYKMVILPDSASLSDREIAELKFFAAGRGVLFAEGMPGIRQANCRRRASSPLAEVFQHDPRHCLLKQIKTDYLQCLQVPLQTENEAVLQIEQDRLEKYLEIAGVETRTLQLFSENGKRIRDASFYPRKGRGNTFFMGILSPSQKQQLVQFRTRKSHHVFNLVNGRYYGKRSSLTLPLSQGIPYGLMFMQEKPSISSLTVKNNTISLVLSTPCDSVVHVTVCGPDGKPVDHYRQNVLVKEGKAHYTVPFALSDAKGNWHLQIRELLSGDTRVVKMVR